MYRRPEGSAEVSNGGDNRRRALRDLLVSAADAARETRKTALSDSISRVVPQAVHERVSNFLTGAR